MIDYIQLVLSSSAKYIAAISIPITLITATILTEKFIYLTRSAVLGRIRARIWS